MTNFVGGVLYPTSPPVTQCDLDQDSSSSSSHGSDLQSLTSYSTARTESTLEEQALVQSDGKERRDERPEKGEDGMEGREDDVCEVVEELTKLGDVLMQIHQVASSRGIDVTNALAEHLRGFVSDEDGGSGSECGGEQGGGSDHDNGSMKTRTDATHGQARLDDLSLGECWKDTTVSGTDVGNDADAEVEVDADADADVDMDHPVVLMKIPSVESQTVQASSEHASEQASQTSTYSTQHSSVKGRNESRSDTSVASDLGIDVISQHSRTIRSGIVNPSPHNPTSSSASTTLSSTTCSSLSTASPFLDSSLASCPIGSSTFDSSSLHTNSFLGSSSLGLHTVFTVDLSSAPPIQLLDPSSSPQCPSTVDTSLDVLDSPMDTTADTTLSVAPTLTSSKTINTHFPPTLSPSVSPHSDPRPDPSAALDSPVSLPRLVDLMHSVGLEAILFPNQTHGITRFYPPRDMTESLGRSLYSILASEDFRILGSKFGWDAFERDRTEEASTWEAQGYLPIPSSFRNLIAYLRQFGRQSDEKIILYLAHMDRAIQADIHRGEDGQNAESDGDCDMMKRIFDIPTDEFANLADVDMDIHIGENRDLPSQLLPSIEHDHHRLPKQASTQTVQEMMDEYAQLAYRARKMYSLSEESAVQNTTANNVSVKDTSVTNTTGHELDHVRSVANGEQSAQESRKRKGEISEDFEANQARQHGSFSKRTKVETSLEDPLPLSSNHGVTVKSSVGACEGKMDQDDRHPLPSHAPLKDTRGDDSLSPCAQLLSPDQACFSLSTPIFHGTLDHGPFSSLTDSSEVGPSSTTSHNNALGGSFFVESHPAFPTDSSRPSSPHVPSSPPLPVPEEPPYTSSPMLTAIGGASCRDVLGSPFVFEPFTFVSSAESESSASSAVSPSTNTENHTRNICLSNHDGQNCNGKGHDQDDQDSDAPSLPTIMAKSVRSPGATACPLSSSPPVVFDGHHQHYEYHEHHFERQHCRQYQHLWRRSSVVSIPDTTATTSTTVDLGTADAPGSHVLV